MRCTSFFCRGDRIRTCDPLVPNQVRYQLRHAPRTDFKLQDKTCFQQAILPSTYHFLIVVGATGFEPATPWSQTRCATNCATPRRLFSPQRTVFLNRRANLVLFFYKSNKMSVKMQNKLIIYKKPMERTAFYDFLSSLYPYP